MQRGLSRKHVHDACHAALRRLRVDYLDLFFCHRPDPDTPVAETVAAMGALVRQGKVLYWGTSEWPASLVREAHAAARANHMQAPTMEQPQYNLLHRREYEEQYAPIASAGNPEQLPALMAASSVTLTDDEVAAIRGNAERYVPRAKAYRLPDDGR